MSLYPIKHSRQVIYIYIFISHYIFADVKLTLAFQFYKEYNFCPCKNFLWHCPNFTEWSKTWVGTFWLFFFMIYWEKINFTFRISLFSLWWEELVVPWNSDCWYIIMDALSKYSLFFTFALFFTSCQLPKF